MNKNELVAAIAEKAGLTKVQAKAALDATVESVTKALAKGATVALIGFGTFSTSVRPARQGKNPRMGESITTPEKTLVKFKAGSDLA